ncbi:MAG: Stp1/IreP family PP2C-type Ser/Thr phosphatase [Acidaminococcaceae bacterium]|nr:Stp1/IreP family PP2C-type Ser/Thr phosphatase [Acidaminococcaceae bacterium]
MRIVSRTHVGLVRENNEDSLLVKKPHLFAVADGMGGYAAGEVASRAALRAFEVGLHNAGDNLQEALAKAFAKANSHVVKMASGGSNLTGMGATLTALYLQDKCTGYCCHIGDSRLYLWRGGELKQLTEDHTVVAGLCSEGKITAAEAKVHPMRHMLLKAVGVSEQTTPDIFKITFQPGDRVLLCSDGLTDMLEYEEIKELLSGENSEEVAVALEEKALENGGRDNISVIMIDFSEEGSVGRYE